ncbi:hypothetical protein SETIT_5G183600v2 [Setaria italica]|uniref:Uncharacterized protein n=1 Tax=Setaria italica TaxID=4555 RepID=A0A368R635_SETIT|nr:hypothetical protein SETIT_5G183600v2 [Setaria italica]
MVTARAVRDGGARCGSGSLRGMRGGALACGDERGKQLQPQHLACVGVFPVVTQWLFRNCNHIIQQSHYFSLMIAYSDVSPKHTSCNT